jgi:YHS domain-containing protein
MVKQLIMLKSYLFLIAFVSLNVLSAQNKQERLKHYNLEKGLAISGYDPVAYFSAGKPVQGSAKFKTTYQGAEFQFSSAANRDTFAANPARYAPQFGGYCAWAVSQGYTAGIDPNAWAIVGGKLYLNYNKDIQTRWQQNTAGNIAAANRNWPTVLKK